MDFAHLHLHTEYSLLDGAIKIKKLMEKIKKLNFSSVAITDHGVLYGIIDFFKYAKEYNIKPIIGIEAYISSNSIKDIHLNKNSKTYHLVLLAKNNEGLKNLIKLNTIAHIEGFYRKPRIDKEILKRYSKGLIALSACLAGEVPYKILQNDIESAKKAIYEYKAIFKDDFYLEVQNHNIKEEQLVAKEIFKLAKETNTKVVITNDAHYLNKEDSFAHEVLLAIQTKKKLKDKDRLTFQTDQFYVKNYEEMAQLYPDHPEILKNTLEVAEKCNVKINIGKQIYLPEFKLDKKYKDSSEYLRHLCEVGLKKRFKNITNDILDRVSYELKVIKEMGFSDYFLIVWDFINYAKKHSIPVGPGRGSVVGSLVAYLLSITELNPLEHGLIFERFLNPGRKSMPDIDTDICFEKRQLLIDYVSNKYGKGNVAQIATFQVIKTKQAIRDAGRVLDIPLKIVDNIAKMIRNEDKSISMALENNYELKEVYNQDKQIKLLLDTAALIEGLKRNISVHAAGVVISRFRLDEVVPLTISNNAIVTQFDGPTVEQLGLLKMDFLGLRTLTVIDHTINMINENENTNIKMENIPLEDKNTYQLLKNANTIGVFQLESSGMRQLLKKLKVENFKELVPLLALYRPGPLQSGMVDDFVKRKHGLAKVEYMHPKLEPILKETYGIILYQEQVMKIANVLAGFTLPQADDLRKAMGKKKKDVMEKYKKIFISGCVKNNIDKELATKLFEQIEYFAGYGFNKSHSAAYAILAYWTAYLKANYPTYYMATLMTSVKDKQDKLKVFLNECKALNIEILPPDVNYSLKNFSVEGNKIRFGLSAIKNISDKSVATIIEERKKNGKYKSLQDFLERLSKYKGIINKKVLETLTLSGALSSFNYNRATLYNNIEKLLKFTNNIKNKDEKQIDLFASSFTPSLNIKNYKEFEKKELLKYEKEYIGLYINFDPLKEYKDLINLFTKIQDINEKYVDKEVAIIGYINSIKELTTQKGDKMAVITIEDNTGLLEATIFPNLYTKLKDWITTDSIIISKGKIQKDNYNKELNSEEEFNFKFITSDIKNITNIKDAKLKAYILSDISNLDKEKLLKLKEILKKHKGNIPTFIKLTDKNKYLLIKVNEKFYISLNKDIYRDIKELDKNLQVKFI